MQPNPRRQQRSLQAASSRVASSSARESVVRSSRTVASRGRSMDGLHDSSKATHSVSASRPKSTPIPITKTAKPHVSIETLSADQKQRALQRALASAQKELRNEKRKVRTLKRSALLFVTAVFVLLTGYASLTALLTNSEAKTEIIASNDESEEAGAGGHTVAAEGKDEAVPTVESLSTYAVAPGLPRALYIDKLSIASKILPMGENKNGSIQAPLNIHDAGWYSGSMKPGQIGAAFIDGHASGPTREGLFAYLDTLVVGDTLQVEKGDGSRLTYKVVHTEVVPFEGFDMKKALLPHGRALRGLNIMTCTGKWVNEKNTYDHRVVVYTEQVN